MDHLQLTDPDAGARAYYDVEGHFGQRLTYLAVTEHLPQEITYEDVLFFLTVTFALAFTVAGKDKTPKIGACTTMLQAVIHINVSDPERQEDAMGNVENILKAVPTAQVEVVCHGKGINLLVTKESKHLDKLKTLMNQGVQFVACENTMKKKALEKDALVPGVTTVPSGAVEVVSKQKEGYGYFRP